MNEQETNMDVTKRWGEAVSSGNLDALDDILADDFVDHDPGDESPDREGVKNFFRGFRAAFPDLKAEPIAIVGAGEYVTLRYNVSGTHTGDFKGHAPTGKSFKAAGMQLAKFKDGKCVERWGVTNEAAIMEQLGLVEV